MTRSLVADLGGTHIRLRLLEMGTPSAPVHVIESKAVASFESAVAQWRERAGIREGLDVIAVAAAGPVAAGRVRITNLDWTLDARAIERTCNTRHCLVVNDVTAIAWALPSLGGSGLRRLGAEDSNGRTRGGAQRADGDGSHSPMDGDRYGRDYRASDVDAVVGGHMAGTEESTGKSAADGVRRSGSTVASGDLASGGDGVEAGRPDLGTADETLASAGLAAVGPCDQAARAVLAPGTGLGVSGLVPTAAGDFAAIEGEGGHRTLAARDSREWAIVTALAQRFGHASAERALSGPGIEAIWRAIASIEGARYGQDKTAAEIARDAFTGDDSIAEETIAMFTGFLGSVAGDLALTLGARGGVYIAGGIVPGWGERFDARRFLEQFHAKGRFRPYLRAVPAYVVTHPYPGLVGLKQLLSRRIAGAT